MPDCYFLKSYSVEDRNGSYSVSLVIEGRWMSANHIAQILEKTYSDVNAESTMSSGSPEIIVTGHLPDMAVLESFLDLLKYNITIIDDLDESHALAPHYLPPTDDNPEWARTGVADLVYSAKDYSRQSPVAYQGSADMLADELGRFIRQHPRYSKADIIMSAPSSDPRRTSDLPSYLCSRLGISLGERIEQAERIWEVPPQKEDDPDERDQAHSIQVNASLQGRRCILLDDLYESGNTLLELGRACRQAGASEVLGLTATKNARYTQGMSLKEWPWG